MDRAFYADAGVQTLVSIIGEDFDDTYKTGGYKCHFADEVGNDERPYLTPHCYSAIRPSGFTKRKASMPASILNYKLGFAMKPFVRPLMRLLHTPNY